MKLIPLSDFVLEQEKAHFYGQTEWSTICERIINYTKFLKQPLTLGMFVPSDKQGKVLEPLQFCCTGSYCGCMGMPVNVSCQEEIDEYYEAKEKVLFEGFEYIGVWGGFSELRHSSGKFLYVRNDGTGIVEKQLLAQSFEIELTPSALKAIGIKE